MCILRCFSHNHQSMHTSDVFFSMRWQLERAKFTWEETCELSIWRIIIWTFPSTARGSRERGCAGRMPQATAAQLAAIDAVVGLLNLSGEALSSSETALAPYEPPTSWDELSDSSHAPPRKVQRLVLVYIDPEHAPPREGLWRLLPDPPATPMAPTPGFKPTPATPRPCPASPVAAACSPGAAPSDEAQDLLAALAAPPLPPARNAVLNNTRAKAKAKAKSKGKAGGCLGSKAASAATSAATMATADKTDGVIAATVAQVDVGVDARVRACLEEMHGKDAGAKAMRFGRRRDSALAGLHPSLRR